MQPFFQVSPCLPVLCSQVCKRLGYNIFRKVWFFFLKGKRNQEAEVDSKANRKNELWGQWLEIRHFSSKRTCFSEVSRIALRGPAGVQSKATSTRTCSVLCLEAAFLTPSLSNIKTAFSSSRIPAPPRKDAQSCTWRQQERGTCTLQNLNSHGGHVVTSAVEDAGTGPGPNNVADWVNSPPVRHRSSARVPAGCQGHYQAPPRTQKDLGCFAQPSGSPGSDPRKSLLIYFWQRC